MRVVVIGGTGHIGSYLIPLLVESGHDVTSISRQQRAPYRDHPAWARVTLLTVDRLAQDQAGRFGDFVRSLAPQVVIDLICYELDSARQLVAALRGQVDLLLTCGTISVYGHKVHAPTTEDDPRQPLNDYGRRKAAIEACLLEEARQNAFPVAVLHPGHITGPGWEPLGPLAHRDLRVFERLARGGDVALPNLGMETLHHVHAADVAAAFMRAIERREHAIGHSFNIVAPRALTLRGYAEAVAGWFGKPANLTFLPWSDWEKTTSAQNAATTRDVLMHSPNCSIAKAQRVLGYTPAYSGIDAIREAVDWLITHEQIHVV